MNINYKNSLVIILYRKIDKIQANKTLKAATRIRTRLAEVNPKQRKQV